MSRTHPLARRSSLRAVLGMPVVVVGLMLGGCAVGPITVTSPTPEPTASTEPAAEPEPLTTVVAAVIRPESLELRDADGTVVVGVDYLAPSADAVVTLTSLLEEEAMTEEFPGSGHFPPTTVHRWEGIELWEQRYVDEWADTERSLARPEFMVRLVAAEASGIDLATSDGRHVGDAWAELIAEPDIHTVASGCSGPYLDFVEVPDRHSQVTGTTMKVSVEFDPTTDETAIGSVSAPMPVFEDACA